MRPASRSPLALCLFAIAFALPCISARADDSVSRQYRFPLEGIDEIRIEGSAGEMHFIETSRDEITLVLEISHQDESWFGNDLDLESVELEHSVRDGRLMLQQTTKETNTAWTIEMPAQASTRVKLGIGEIEGELGATALDVELGVGHVDIKLPGAAIGDIDLSVGVGEARLRGARSERENRAFVSHDVRGEGKGNMQLDVHVGVGEIEVSLTDGGSI